MTSFKPITSFLAASLGIHAVFMGAVSLPMAQRDAQKEKSITISYPSYSFPNKNKSISTHSVMSKAMPRKKKAVVRESRELLTDPQKGKFFLSYFIKVKENIHKTVRRKRIHLPKGYGTVGLTFILRADGRLEDIRIVPAGTRASEKTQAFAVRCVQETSPFQPFPMQLEADKIAFHLTLLFEEN